VIGVLLTLAGGQMWPDVGGMICSVMDKLARAVVTGGFPTTVARM
jgi:hypothetical protein